MIPGLANAEFFRYGVMHRNTYLRSPGVLTPQYAVKSRPSLFFAGQMTGVEGYVESTSSGYVAGINAARLALGMGKLDFPSTTEIGALAHYISESIASNFQPMNANFGVIAPFDKKIKGGKIARNQAYAERSLAVLREMVGID
jgi:methylenetetrahydrofolate--tRNA-(uracil-5-)-methyltransferase